MNKQMTKDGWTERYTNSRTNRWQRMDGQKDIQIVGQTDGQMD